ncbi:hypothetical protein ABPG77_006210 [Micractinium sp. CCAP 211/92]
MPLQQVLAKRAWLPTKCSTRSVRAARTCGIVPRAFMTKHDAAELTTVVERFVAAVNAHDVEGLCTSMSQNVVWSDRVWCSCDLVGLKKVRRVHQELFAAYPDFTLHTEELLAREDSNTAALHFTARGTCFGEWRGFPPSGRRSTFSGVSLFTFDPERNDVIKQVVTYRQPSQEEYVLYLGHEDL